MHGPAVAGWLLTALCAATGGYCLLRMRSRVPEQRRSAGGEAFMGFAMAAMALPAAWLAPPATAWRAVAVLFAASAVAGLLRRSAHGAHHAVGSLAMVHMALAAAAGAHHGGSPLLTGVLLVYFCGYVVLAGARLVPVPAAVAGPAAAPAGWGDRPELAAACRLSMGIGMLAMLLTM
ncbi:DUF5134 domain-containing protein [Streptomyces sp. NPDC060194]|uniref:DUF5134 domain-containing protein n=1 Tax=Streptomyces sp. NPDC060194 TaxID=3347069 RepID=UPI003659FB11